MWLHSVTPIAPPRSSNPGVRSLLYAAVVVGTWAGVICLVIFGLGSLLGVPFEVVLSQGQAPVRITWFMPFVLTVLVSVLAGFAIVLVLGRKHARVIVLIASVVVVLASLVLPLMQPSTVLWSTRIWLLVMHLLAWLVIVPQLARIAGDSEPAASEVREFQLESR